MKITFIRPSIGGRRSSDAMEPLAFAILAGLTPTDDETVLWDERLEPIPFDDPTDLVAITVETFTARRAYQIARQFQQRGVPVVMGGYHPTFLPEEALRFADAVVAGDAEGVWPEVVEDARRGKLRRLYQSPEFPGLEGLRVDRSIFRGKRYGPIMPVQFSRGCRYACDFCSIHAFYGRSMRQRPVGEVVAEIEGSGKRTIVVVDDNIFVDIAKAEELFRALIPLNIQWGCQVSIDIVRNQKLLDLMARSGCISALIGFESLNEHNLRQMAKGWNITRGGGYGEVVRAFQERGIMLYGSFVFGYDHDTVDSFDRTLEFAQRANLFLMNFTPLTPTPGSRLYNRLHTEGRLIHTSMPWWLDPEYRYGSATFQPRGMTADELTEGCVRGRQAFYSAGSIARRAIGGEANHRSLRHLVLFIAANRVSRCEIHRKLGYGLGLDEPLDLSSTVHPDEPPEQIGISA